MKRQLAVCFVLLTGMGVAQGEDSVMAVLSSSLDHYRESLNGFRSCFPGSIKEYILPAEDGIDFVKKMTIVHKPGLIFTIGSGATQAAQTSGVGMPVVFSMVLDPAGSGLSSAGVALELKASDQIEFIRQNFPGFKRVGILYGPNRYKGLVQEFRSLKGAGMEVVLKEVRSPDELFPAMSALAREADCLLMVSDPEVYPAVMASQIILHALRESLPLIAGSPAYVRAGALAGVYADPVENGCQAGRIASRLLAGDRSSTPSVVRASQVRSAVNLVVAQRLSVKMGPDTVKRAELVVK